MRQMIQSMILDANHMSLHLSLLFLDLFSYFKYISFWLQFMLAHSLVKFNPYSYEHMYPNRRKDRKIEVETETEEPMEAALKEKTESYSLLSSFLCTASWNSWIIENRRYRRALTFFFTLPVPLGLSLSLSLSVHLRLWRFTFINVNLCVPWTTASNPLNTFVSDSTPVQNAAVLC